VKFDEEIVGALPGDQRMMPEVQHEDTEIHRPFQQDRRSFLRNSTRFELTGAVSVAPHYPDENQLPILPFPPVLPLPPS
jgi:hypothetical protein